MMLLSSSSSVTDFLKISIFIDFVVRRKSPIVAEHVSQLLDLCTECVPLPVLYLDLLWIRPALNHEEFVVFFARFTFRFNVEHVSDNKVQAFPVFSSRAFFKFELLFHCLNVTLQYIALLDKRATLEL